MLELMQSVVQYGTTTIQYRLEFRDRRRTLGIEVYPDGLVLVLAPKDTDLTLIQTRVLKRAAWILRQQRELRSYPPPQPERRFVAGETHRYLGKQYRLKLETGTIERVKLERGFLLVASKPERVGVLLEHWFRARAEAVFAERTQLCLERVRSFGIEHDGAFRLRRMAKRWGSCTAGGMIYLNPLLIAAPKECIDYVITHELVHTVHLHHQKKFYALLTKCLPSWQALRLKLNTLVELPKVVESKRS
jgi:predicted metal-dependent hydrolase